MYDRAPGGALRPFVRRFGCFDERTPAPIRRRQLASAQVVWVIDLAGTLRTLASDGACTEPTAGVVAGLQSSVVRTEHSGVSRGVVVSFTAIGAHRFFGTVLRELAGRVVTIAELWRREGDAFVERLHDVTSWASRLALVEGFVTARLSRASSSPLLEAALGQLDTHGGRPAIEPLARTLGCTRKHLHAVFREQLGVPPKLFSRLVRFEHLVDRLERTSRVRDWAMVALEAGYADQAHMIREFRDFARAPPGEVCRRRRPDGGGLTDD